MEYNLWAIYIFPWLGDAIAVRFPDNGYDSSHLFPHAPGCRDGVRRLHSFVIAGGRIQEKVGEADFPQRSGAA